jgi:transcriptional regulator GlxA family with amidase domain
MPLEFEALAWLKEQVVCIHDRSTDIGNKVSTVGEAMLREILKHYARHPISGNGRVEPLGPARIVHDALKFIRENLTQSIGVDAISEATGTSRRSLYRAFSEVLGDTPQNHVRRLRLHRLRRELISSQTTVSAAAASWGCGQDLGRLSRSYRNIFGENPSSTLAIGRALRNEK